MHIDNHEPLSEHLILEQIPAKHEDALAAACHNANRDLSLAKEIDEWQAFDDGVIEWYSISLRPWREPFPSRKRGVRAGGRGVSAFRGGIPLNAETPRPIGHPSIEREIGISGPTLRFGQG